MLKPKLVQIGLETTVTTMRDRFYIQLQNSFCALGDNQPPAQQEPNQLIIADKQNDPEQVSQVESTKPLSTDPHLSPCISTWASR